MMWVSEPFENLLQVTLTVLLNASTEMAFQLCPADGDEQRKAHLEIFIQLHRSQITSLLRKF